MLILYIHQLRLLIHILIQLNLTQLRGRIPSRLLKRTLLSHDSRLSRSYLPQISQQRVRPLVQPQLQLRILTQTSFKVRVCSCEDTIDAVVIA